MVTGVGNATLYQENLVKGYLTIPKKPGVRPISIPHPLGWGGRTQFDFFGVFVVFVFEKQDDLYVFWNIINHFCTTCFKFFQGFFPFFFLKRHGTAFYYICPKASFQEAQAVMIY